MTSSRGTANRPSGTLGVSMALAFQIIPKTYRRAGNMLSASLYDGPSFNSFMGAAVYLGRTFYFLLVSAAWDVKVAGPRDRCPAGFISDGFSPPASKICASSNFDEAWLVRTIKNGKYFRAVMSFDRSGRNPYMRPAFASLRTIPGVLVLVAAMLAPGGPSRAQEPATVEISVKGQRFQPTEIHAPANRPVVLRVKNLDATPVEFESVSLRVEKVVAPGTQGVVNIRPLAPGQYEFFDDFHRETRGTLVVQ